MLRERGRLKSRANVLFRRAKRDRILNLETLVSMTKSEFLLLERSTNNLVDQVLLSIKKLFSD